MKKLLLSALAVSVMFVSCNNKDDDNPTPPKKVDTMAKGVFKDIYAIQKGMYTASSTDLVKDFDKFKNDVAVDGISMLYQAEVQSQFTDWLNNVKPEGEATDGTAGKIMDGTNTRYLDAKGVETGQLIKKGFIGAYQLSNSLKYWFISLSAKDKETREKVLKGVSVSLLGSYDYIDNVKTKMESHGKEFNGYPVMDGNEFAKYLNVVSYLSDGAFGDPAHDLYEALKEAKANLDNQEKFKSNISKACRIAQKVVAIRGIQYLKVGEELGDKDKFAHVAHEISEGLGFVYSLQFAYREQGATYLSKQEVNEFLNNLNLWDTQAAKTSLEEMSKKIAERFNDLNWEDIKKA